MIRVVFPLLFSSILLFFFSCKPDPVDPVINQGTFELNFLARVGGQVFEKNTEFENILGQTYSVEIFRMYLSDLTLVKEDGTDTLIAETILFDFGEEEVGKVEHGEGLFTQYTIPAGSYKGVKFGIGVPASRNNSDPTDYASDHPLSVTKGMHWNWTSGYKFLQIDGRIDSSEAGNGPLDLGMAYHTGINSLYREVEYVQSEHAFDVSKDVEVQFQIELDLNRLFYTSTDTINMAEQPLTHTTPEGSEAYQLAEKITDNLVNTALYKVPFLGLVLWEIRLFGVIRDCFY